jgi:Ras family protein T1
MWLLEQEQSEEVLFDELLKANVICVVYAANQKDTIEKVDIWMDVIISFVQLMSYWLPTIQRILGVEHGKPIILVGNKIDELPSNVNHMEVSVDG